MNYERIILELLDRIKFLEEQVATLIADRDSSTNMEDAKMTNKSPKNYVTTDDIRDYINDLKNTAKENGKTTLVLVARDIHRELNLKDRYPMVCNAMRDCMGENDVVLFEPPKKNSSTVEIEYRL